jgi:hypothetical protein
MDIQRIKFERTGGFAGIRLAAEFELDDLPEEQAHRLRELLDDLDIDEYNKKHAHEPRLLDGFSYTIQVQTKKHEYIIETGDNTTSEKMNDLLALLTQVIRSRARKSD